MFHITATPDVGRTTLTMTASGSQVLNVAVAYLPYEPEDLVMRKAIAELKRYVMSQIDAAADHLLGHQAVKDEAHTMYMASSTESLQAKSSSHFEDLLAAVEPKVGVQDALRSVLPGLWTPTLCPMEKCSENEPLSKDGLPPYTLSWVIQHLNDRHRWTRYAIADWLEDLDIDLTFPAASPTE